MSNARVQEAPPDTMTISGCGHSAESGSSAIMVSWRLRSCTARPRWPRIARAPGQPREDFIRGPMGVERGDTFEDGMARVMRVSLPPPELRNCQHSDAERPVGGNASRNRCRSRARHTASMPASGRGPQCQLLCRCSHPRRVTPSGPPRRSRKCQGSEALRPRQHALYTSPGSVARTASPSTHGDVCPKSEYRRRAPRRDFG